MIWKSDLRRHEDGRLSDRYTGPSSADALSHFRRLLARDDLIGQPVAARLVSPLTRRAVYWSRFDRDLGDGRIHPDAPLDPMRDDDGSDKATLWRPPAQPDAWSDPRPFAPVLRDWMARHGLTYEGACAALTYRGQAVSRRALAGWLADCPPAHEGPWRALMARVDEGRHAPRPVTSPASGSGR